MANRKALIIASAAGMIISAILLITPSSLGWFGPGAPGLAATVVFWRILGEESLWGVAVAWVANAAVYGAGAFALLAIINRSKVSHGR